VKHYSARFLKVLSSFSIFPATRAKRRILKTTSHLRRNLIFQAVPQLEKNEKNAESSWFACDLVARGSSGLKPLRRRAPDGHARGSGRTNSSA